MPSMRGPSPAADFFERGGPGLSCWTTAYRAFRGRRSPRIDGPEQYIEGELLGEARSRRARTRERGALRAVSKWTDCAILEFVDLLLQVYRVRGSLPFSGLARVNVSCSPDSTR